VEYSELDPQVGDLLHKVSNNFLSTELQYALPDMSLCLLQQITKNGNLYKDVIDYLPKNEVDVYIENTLTDELSATVKLLLMASWHNESDENSHIILIPRNFLLWDPDETLIKYGVKCEGISTFVSPKRLVILIIIVIKTLKKKMLIAFEWFIKKKNKFGHAKQNFSKVLIRYVEGIDLTKRSDIFWVDRKIIQPNRILMLIGPAVNRVHKQALTNKISSRIEELGMNWITTNKNNIEFQAKPENIYRGRWKIAEGSLYREISIFQLLKKCRTRMDWWLFVKILRMLYDIDCEMAFLQEYGIKIDVDIATQSSESITKCIAIDFVNGIRIGFQRSNVAMMSHLPYLRYNSNHIFFVWGKEAQQHKGTSHVIRNLLISGFPFDCIVRERQHFNTDLRMKYHIPEEKFVIALFDNMYGGGNFTKRMITVFYEEFLKWAIEDEQIFVICKEKKPGNIARLTSISHLVSEAVQTNRFIRLDNVLGRFPSDASHGADMAIGIGISSAVDEAVIAGTRGIHCDIPGDKTHKYYQWGHEKIVFDDIGRLIVALKQYKNDQESNPGLGDWSSHIDELDPFRDGRSGERISTYICSILDGFDCGHGQLETIERANSTYAEAWGEDKVYFRERLN
jgi:hypothetical protein